MEVLLAEEIKLQPAPIPNVSLDRSQGDDEGRMREDYAKKYADFCMFKIASMTEHKAIIDLEPKSEEMKQKPIRKDQEVHGI